MYRAHLVFRPFRHSPKPLILGLIVALLAVAHPTSAATISSRVLIDPVGENNADSTRSSPLTPRVATW